MKKIFLLLLINTTITFAQISQPDFDKAMKLLNGNEPAKALTNLELLEKKAPKDAKVIFLRGFYQFREGNQNGAMMSFSNALKTNPKFALAYGARAQLFASKGMLDKAISDISVAITIEPKNIDFLSTRAGFYNQNNQFAEGLEDMKTKIKLAPNDIMGYFDAAVFSKSIDKNKNADDFFSQAYANKGLQKFVTDVLFAKFLLKYGRFDEAKTKYEAALATNEKDFGDEDFNDAAIVYYKLKNYDKAILYANKAIAKTPTNVNFHLNLASTYVDLQNWQKVKETAQNAINADANNPMANMYMAIGLKFTGNESKALEYETKAKQLDAAKNR
jgi:tetratricopeptide (TPR) repeat protein